MGWDWVLPSFGILVLVLAIAIAVMLYYGDRKIRKKFLGDEKEEKGKGETLYERALMHLEEGRKKAKETPNVIREKEIIREIVKIRCPYCRALYDESNDKCPHCGGTR